MFKNKLVKCVIASAMLAMPMAWAEIYKYDFSGDRTAETEGFVRISEKTNDNVRWKEHNVVVLGQYKPISYEWKMNAGRGREVPPSVYATELSCGYVFGEDSTEFTLPKVAPGEYHVWVLSGQSGKDGSQVWDTALTAGTGSARLTFPGGHELMDMEFDTKVGSGGLHVKVETRSKWIINAMIIVPKSEWKAFRDGELKSIRQDCFMLPPEVLKRWRHTPKKCEVPEPKWSEADKQKGFAIYSRPWSEPVWPDHFPVQHEIGAPVRSFASWGEYEPMTFTVYPFKDFESADVTVSDLVEPSGSSIPASTIDLRYVRYMNARPNYSTFNVYYRVPDVLMPWSTRRLEKGENLRVWITVKVPVGIKAGLYYGEAALKLDGAVAAKVPLTLRVLPITLTRDESLIYGQYYTHPLRYITGASDSFSRAWWEHKAEKEHEDMREIGMNTLVLSLGGSFKNGRFVYSYDAFQRNIDLYRKYGFNKPIALLFPVGARYAMYESTPMGSHLSTVKIPKAQFFSDITAMVAEIQAEAVRRQWPELLYYPIDEPSTSPVSVEFMLRIMKAIKAVPGVRTYITADPIHEAFEVLRPYVDVWCCQPFTFPKSRILKDMAERKGLEYWCYPNHISGENDHTPVLGARMTYGFGFWESGFRCLIPWIYQSISGSQWNYLDSTSSDFVNRTDMDGNPIPVTLWVAYREGIDDGRYINTLEKMIGRAEAAGFKRQAKQARTDLELIRAAIKVQPKYKHDGLWNGETFDVYRWLIAKDILDLQGLF